MTESELPPPSLHAPAGYAAYQATNWQPGMFRLRGLAIGILAALGLSIIASLSSLAAIGSAKDAGEQFLAGTLTNEEFDDKLASWGLGGVLAVLAMPAVLILTMIWLYRMTRNHRTLGRALFWAPGWAIAGWFLPPFLFVIPLLMLFEAWKAADPQSPPGSTSWKRGSPPILVIAWFAVFGIARTAATFLTGSPFDQFSREREDVARRFADHAAGLAVQSIVEIVSAVLFGLLVWQLSRRHAALTGEANAR